MLFCKKLLPSNIILILDELIINYNKFKQSPNYPLQKIFIFILKLTTKFIMLLNINLY
jgi:hypothetical protein